jgi:hypothetical protein
MPRQFFPFILAAAVGAALIAIAIGVAQYVEHEELPPPPQCLQSGFIYKTEREGPWWRPERGYLIDSELRLYRVPYLRCLKWETPEG